MNVFVAADVDDGRVNITQHNERKGGREKKNYNYFGIFSPHSILFAR
jgi:hypothetical protein